jgi:hypothetical protein
MNVGNAEMGSRVNHEYLQGAVLWVDVSGVDVDVDDATERDRLTVRILEHTEVAHL